MGGLDINSAAAQVSALTEQVTSNASLWIGNFIALIALSAALLIFAMRGGRSGLVSLILSLYAGYALYAVFPYTDIVLSAGGTPLIKALLSVALYIGSCIFPFMLIRRLTGGGFGVVSFVPNFILSILTACFLLALSYHVFSVNAIYHFPEPMNTLFAPNSYFFWWFIAPLIGMFVLVH